MSIGTAILFGACSTNTDTTNAGLDGSWIAGDIETFAIVENYEAGKWTAEAYSQGTVVADIAADYTVTSDSNGVMTIAYSNFVGVGAEEASPSVTAEIKGGELLITEDGNTRTYQAYNPQ